MRTDSGAKRNDGSKMRTREHKIGGMGGGGFGTHGAGNARIIVDLCHRPSLHCPNYYSILTKNIRSKKILVNFWYNSTF